MSENNQLVEEKISWGSAIWVSTGDAAMAIMQSVIGGGALTYFFTRVMGLSTEMAGLAWLIFGIWNAVNDPLLGYIADRTKSKIGRRKPYIRYGAPLAALFFIILWIQLPGSQDVQWLLFAQLLVGLFLYDTLYTAIATSLYLMPYEMAVSNKARSRVFIWKIIFMAFSTGLPLVVIPLIQPGPGDDPMPFRYIMIGLGLVMGALIFVSSFFYDEKHFQQGEHQFSFLRSLKECFTNRSFLNFLIVSFTVIYIQTNLMMGVLYYFDEIDVPALPVYIALAVGIVAGVFLWVNMRDRWGLKKCLIIWLGLFVVGCILMLSLGKVMTAAVISFLLVGLGFAGGMYLIPLMNGDVIDFDETRTGLRREGMYAGINSLVTKPAISIAQAAFLWFLGLFGYNQSLAKGLQSATAETGILMAWMAIPAVLLVISFIAMFWYPLSGKSWETTKHDLAKVHTEKEKKYLESLGYKSE